ncbi:hypothetical protein RJ639_030588 [Escallonia herrerae]|uniref:MLO-like protein n=1 Tax=Escallonia herrerae TaxID=1293975 RepID=A0AA88X2L0_9ASTE|nr:hypothetical protein RJ639_030588 [Escallonia herrerae]
MAIGSNAVQSLQYTPTWAVATVCFFIIAISIFLEHSIHLITNWLKRRRKAALYDAVDRLKSELMLLGFVSLLLAVTQDYITKICISTKAADIMLPCRKRAGTKTTTAVEAYEQFSTIGVIRSLLSVDGSNSSSGSWTPHRLLAEDETTVADSCSAEESWGRFWVLIGSTEKLQGKTSLVTSDGLHQLHIFLFVLAVMQIVYSVLTMGLGRAKMRRWKAWEKETQTTEYLVANGISFDDANCDINAQKCFFRQFFHSVAKVDYLTLRHGFITAHMSLRNNHFNFQKYIQRTLEEDFKVVVSVSPLMWFIVVIFMLVDVHGWNVYLWVSYVPLLIVLALGTKLEVIVAKMALQLQNQNSVIIGAPLVRPNDDLFWFGRPRFILTLLHLNAFEFAFFIWVTVQFGWDSCYHEHTIIIITRIVLAVTVQVLCSYITLPLYALVTQMGSQVKSRVIEEQMAKVIKQWHAEVRARRRREGYSFQSPRNSFSSLWSLRNSLSSHRRPGMLQRSESNRDPSNGEEISEASRESTSTQGGSARFPPRAFMQEWPIMMRRDTDLETTDTITASARKP